MSEAVPYWVCRRSPAPHRIAIVRCAEAPDAETWLQGPRVAGRSRVLPSRLWRHDPLFAEAMAKPVGEVWEADVDRLPDAGPRHETDRERRDRRFTEDPYAEEGE